MEGQSNKIGKNLSYYPLTKNEGYYEVDSLPGVKFLAEGATPSTQKFDIRIDGLPMNEVELPRLREVMDTLSEIQTSTAIERSLINKWYVGMDKYLSFFEQGVVGQLNELRSKLEAQSLELLITKVHRDDYRKMTRVLTIMSLFFLIGFGIYLAVDHHFGMIAAVLANFVSSIALFKYGKEAKFNVVRDKTPEPDVAVVASGSDPDFFI